MDSLVKGFSEKRKIRFTYVDVTESAKVLEQRHLSGPTAGRLLAQGLAGAALLSADASQEDERVTLQLQVDGLVGGLLTEASFEGTLRGYTHEKIMNDLDGDDDTDLAKAMGVNGRLTVIQSTSTATLASGSVKAVPPDLPRNLAKFFIQSRQTPTALDVHAKSKGGYLNSARAIMAERMPDGDVEEFVRILEIFNDGKAAKALKKCTGLGDFKKLFKIDDLEVVEMRELHFDCSCNRERIISMMGTLEEDELRAIVDENKSQTVTCHFCGESYIISPETMKEVLARKLGLTEDTPDEEEEEDEEDFL